MGTHTRSYNLCFGPKIRKKVYPCIPQFYYIKVGLKGVFIAWTCFPDDESSSVLFQLLDDNRELYIPETQETIKAHPKFMLFATQNPPGQYGGRKVGL